MWPTRYFSDTVPYRMAATTPLQWIIYIWGPTLFSMTQSSKRKYCHFDENSWLAAPLVILTFPMCFCLCKTDIISRSGSLRWRHNGGDSVSNHQPHDCLLNRLFRRRSKKTPKLRVTGLCAGNSPGTGEFPARMVSNAENVSIWWRHPEHMRAFITHAVWPDSETYR